MKIFITGGHVTPAIAVIEEIQKRLSDLDIVFIGRKYAMEGDIEVSAEHKLISSLGIRFLSLTTGRLQRSFTLMTIPSLLKIPFGLAQALWYLLKERPAIIVSFGGYIALPVVIAGWIVGIPSLTHEQTQTVGGANFWIAKIAKIVCVSYADMVNAFPEGKAIYTGLPLRKELFALSVKPLFPLSSKYPLLYIAGGATGSEFINQCIFSILPELLKQYIVVHQTGYSAYATALEKFASLSKDEQSHYHIFPYIKIDELAWVYRHAHIYIGRSGANTVGELAALGKVSLFIPLPWSAQKEQEKNAQWLVNAGSPSILHQEDITQPSRLLEKIEEVLAHYEHYHKKAQEFSKEILLDGASRMVDEIQKLFP